jgi:hypothetical protein
MLAEMRTGQRKLFFIEWKYVEQYKNQPSKALGESGKTRIKTYKILLESNDCPIKSANIEGLFTEPYYQLMRQTLLAYEMVRAKEYGVSDYQHLHIIPKANKELKDVNTAAGKIDGSNLQETWCNILKSHNKYKVIDPKDFINPARVCNDVCSWMNYLGQRYWD